MKLNIMVKFSDNYSKEEVINPKYIILHCIGYEEKQALTLLSKSVKDGGGGVSAHYFIPDIKQNFINDDSGYPIYQLVPDDKKAWHAGISVWKEEKALNACSIGIEFNSPNYANAQKKQASDDFNWHHFEEFGDDQIKAGIELLQQVIRKHNIEPQNILGHSDIAPWKDTPAVITLGKTDPGATFPWERLARAGISIWPKHERTRSGSLDASILNTQRLLAEYGYAVEATGELDAKTQHVINAFQLHFLPGQRDGKISEKMIIFLENLIDRQYQYAPTVSQVASRGDSHLLSTALK